MSDQAGAIENQAGAVGLAVVSDQAVAIGVTAIPTPVTDQGSDLWFMHQGFYGDESKLTDRVTSATRFAVDSKAMRKVDVGEDVVHVIESSGIGSGLIIFISGRMLIKVN